MQIPKDKLTILTLENLDECHNAIGHYSETQDAQSNVQLLRIKNFDINKDKLYLVLQDLHLSYHFLATSNLEEVDTFYSALLEDFDMTDDKDSLKAKEYLRERLEEYPDHTHILFFNDNYELRPEDKTIELSSLRFKFNVLKPILEDSFMQEACLDQEMIIREEHGILLHNAMQDILNNKEVDLWQLKNATEQTIRWQNDFNQTYSFETEIYYALLCFLKHKGYIEIEKQENIIHIYKTR